MKLSFSTLGCPLWTWEDILATAKDFGYSGVELRGVENELYVPNAKPFKKENIEKTKSVLAEMGLEISCLTSGALLHRDEKDYISEAMDYIDIAQLMGVKYIRVLGDANPAPYEEVDMSRLKTALSQVAKYANDRGVTALIETNGIFAKSKRLAELVDSTGEGVGILWDVHHPYRFFDEKPEETFENIKHKLCHVHLKDSVLVDGKVKYKMLGEGDVPVSEAINLLKQNDYKGYVSLEWVKRWEKDLEDPGVVFMHFVNTVNRMLRK